MKSSILETLYIILKKKQTKIFFAIFLVTSIAAVWLYFGLEIDHYSKLYFDTMRHKIIRFGKLSILIFIAIYVVKSLFVILPSSHL